MAKSNVYLEKLELAKKYSMTGMRLKMAMYNAVRQCYTERKQFPYRKLLEEYCIPGKKKYIEGWNYPFPRFRLLCAARAQL